MSPRNRFKPSDTPPRTLTPPDTQTPASVRHSAENTDDWPCATCNRWSQDCCGPWETPEEHAND